MSIIGAWPRSFCLMSIQRWPWRGIGAATPGQSLPTYSSMADSVHNWQFVHSATSMIMFHFFIVLSRPVLPDRPLAGYEDARSPR